jgi:hypothetical protein
MGILHQLVEVNPEEASDGIQPSCMARINDASNTKRFKLLLALRTTVQDLRTDIQARNEAFQAPLPTLKGFKP